MSSRRIASVLTTTLLALPVVALTATDADAGGYKYKNCTALARVFPHGVAKSPAAAAKQVRAGYGRPSTTARGTWSVPRGLVAYRSKAASAPFPRRAVEFRAALRKSRCWSRS